MKLVGTTITETAVKMRYADNSNPEHAKFWIDFQVPLAALKQPSDTLLGDAERHFLATAHQAALRHVRDVIAGEMHRISDLRNSTLG